MIFSLFWCGKYELFITGKTLPIYYLPILSDPTEKDSDGDSLNDNDDEKPLVNYTNNLNNCINKLKSMECYIVEYWNSIGSNRTDLTLCCMDLIRMIKYNGFRWNMTVGKPEGVGSEEKIKEYINSQDASIIQYFESMNNHIIYDVYGNEVDFIHLIATLRAQYNDYLPSKIMIDEDLSGWLGDLQSLIYDLKKETYGKDKNLNETAAILITNENTNFSMPDMIADIDAKNMYYLYNINIALSQIVEKYYKNYSSQRYNLFIDKSGGISSLKKKAKKYTSQGIGINHKLLGEYSDKATSDFNLFDIYLSNYKVDELDNKIYYLHQPNIVSKEETEALVYAFISFIQKKADEENET